MNLVDAIRFNDLQLFTKIILKPNFNVNQIVDDFNSTALHLAIFYNRPEIIKLLVQLKANINAQNHDGDTPLIYAINENKNNVTLVKYLLKHGANPNIINNYGHNALSFMCYGYDINFKIIKKFLTPNSNINCLLDKRFVIQKRVIDFVELYIHYLKRTQILQTLWELNEETLSLK